jgi:hypothetical protein
MKDTNNNFNDMQKIRALLTVSETNYGQDMKLRD